MNPFKLKISEVYWFIGLFFVSIIILYRFPHIFAHLFFWGLLVVFVSAPSSKNHFWLLFFWLLFAEPGYLFYSLGDFNLPSLSISSLGREVFYNEIFTILLIFKVIIIRIKQKPTFYYKPIIILIGYAVFLLIIGLFSGSSVLTVLKSIRYFIPLLLLVAIPNLIPVNQMTAAVRLMFVTVFILVGAQMVDVITGSPIASYLGETSFKFSGVEVDALSKVFDVADGPVRSVYGPFILLTSLVYALFLLLKRDWNFKPYYLLIIAFLTSFSIFVSATRGWILAVGVILIGYFILDIKRIGKFGVIGIVLLVLAFSLPKIKLQIQQSFKRTLTLESFAEGDLTANGTLNRISVRSPRVMNKFYESPVFGFGFSEDFYKYQDGHVGNQTLLLNGGVVGYLFFLFFFIFFMTKCYTRSRVYGKRGIAIFLFGLLGLLVIHSSSRMVFGYSLDVETAISLSLFFLLADFAYKYTSTSTQPV